ncbi:MAG: hypothetical protein PHG85_02335 [Candidatus Altiarchaeota archaeon]|nr:hypothetical protein [Candidatus Altiarchaeota archaeon]
MGERSNTIFYYRVVFWCVCILLTLFVFLSFIQTPGLNSNPIAMFADYVDGSASKPFAYRILVPLVVRAVAAVLAQGVGISVLDSLQSECVLRDFFVYVSWEEDLLVEYLVACLLAYLSLVGFVLALRYLVRSVFELPAFFVDGVTIFSICMLPIFFCYGSYLYDFPALFFFTLLLALMVNGRWLWFIFVFVASCLNKETTILVTLLFFAHFFGGKRMGRALFNKLLAFQILAFSTVKAALFLVFAGNEGHFVWFELNRNIGVLGAVIPRLVLYALPAAFFVFYRWQAKPSFLKNGLWVIAALLYLNLAFGFIDELRDYYELYPVVILSACHTLLLLFGIRVRLNAMNERLVA